MEGSIGNTMKWLGLFLSLICSVLTGLDTGFNVYAIPLKKTFNYTQTEVELVGSASVMGIGMAFTEKLLTARYGYRSSYLVSSGLTTLSCLSLWITVKYREIFRNFPGLVALFQLLCSSGANMSLLVCSSIAVNNVQTGYIGTMVGLHWGASACGKIAYALLYREFFEEDLGGFFLAIAIIFAIVSGLCAIFHKPQTATPTGEKDAKGSQEATDREALLAVGSSIVPLKKMLKSSYFHLKYWCALILYAGTFTFVTNITVIGYSVTMIDSSLLVYVLTVIDVLVRVSFGIIFDRSGFTYRGFALVLICTLSSLSSAMIGILWLNDTNIFLVTVLIGISLGAGFTVPSSMLVVRFGSQH